MIFVVLLKKKKNDYAPFCFLHDLTYSYNVELLEIISTMNLVKA